jgi:predicted transcriptional regulator
MDAAEAVRRIHELEAKLQAANDQIKAMEMTLRNQSFTSNVSGSRYVRAVIHIFHRAETSINQHTSGDNTYGTYGLLVGFRGCVGKTE